MTLLGAPTDHERKRLGQYFTGPTLSRLLASLADSASAARVIDPMAGSGDLVMAALERGGGWQRLDAIEIDPRAADVCNSRLAIPAPHASVRRANAFDPSTWQQVANERWDLVITNPPYVRYQRGSAGSLGEIAVPSAQQVRLGLLAVLDSYTALPEADRKVWRYVARHYGGLSDLAVPSWILCSAMVAPGGRLAIVAPDTWLSREYASPVLYLLRRYFEIEAVVEDGDASWFPDALVRTTLLVARRVSDRGSGLIEGSATYRHVRLDATTATPTSVVGALYADSVDPEGAFISELQSASQPADGKSRLGGRTRQVPDMHLRSLIMAREASSGWIREIEPVRCPASQPCVKATSQVAHLPSEMANHLGLGAGAFTTLGELGWQAGQGLRTGANRFFYCMALGDESETELVEVDPWLSSTPLRLPGYLLAPVIRKQQDLSGELVATETPGRVLLLGGHALPEDIDSALRQGVRTDVLPLSGAAASLVRRAALMSTGSVGSERSVPELSAVVTNIRSADPARPDRQPRYWYQLPPLAPRHRPEVFMARINHLHPLAVLNRGHIVDANFSTFWPVGATTLSNAALMALLNSSWASAMLESTATVLGGGGLKVEATHLRSLPIPLLTSEECSALNRVGTALARPGVEVERVRAAANELLGAALQRAGAVDDAIEALRITARQKLGMRNPRVSA
ncbi:MAG TPA: N-6 DNA methylase [Ilumatobacteraceae bacterium]|jgi:16S rRNA G966 N2-methylase RsmD|nr:N-6 DNA methylase [Acidimicrobiaceae bacterium]MBP6486947.1 N-6 DNA methylase [Ilumatobacteraceae bacterium]MBP7889302.1 N-6 DNA methylase [Ilumatobacteraceae bacterium]HAN36723.1 hypothetical protein [Acidimicrobiaceae bacterium]HQZ36368.1 N-6 DNA methylase [Ilumatobacteraceae bacterium]